jgi:3-oxoacyl-[acyl-carrier protein] reductase
MVLKDRTAIVTGAARGIGKAISMRFAAEGAFVVLVDLDDPTEAQEAIDAAGGQALPRRVDITDPGAVEAMVAEAARARGGVDILVNNAGIIARGSILDLGLETWKRVFDVNVNGAFNCCKAVLPHMIRAGRGRIVTISSVAGKMGDITAAPAYGASKGALNAFTKSMARQLAGFCITVNAIAPHAIETDMSAEWSEEKRAEVIAGIPLKRLGKPEEVAAAALYLASDEAAFITGAILDVNGGFLMD